jgi:hypothetical protein
MHKQQHEGIVLFDSKEKAEVNIIRQRENWSKEIKKEVMKRLQAMVRTPCRRESNTL